MGKMANISFHQGTIFGHTTSGDPTALRDVEFNGDIKRCSVGAGLATGYDLFNHWFCRFCPSSQLNFSFKGNHLLVFLTVLLSILKFRQTIFVIKAAVKWHVC
jgi:hypothetical protein